MAPDIEPDDLYKSPAFQFYADDFVADTSDLNTEEIGAYVLLICRQWKKGFLPGAITSLSRIMRLRPSKAKRVWAVLEGRFVPHPILVSSFIQARLERVRGEAKRHSLDRAKAGKKGADSRWQAHGSAMAQPSQTHGTANATAMANDGSPVSSLQSPSRVTNVTPIAKTKREPSEEDLAAYLILKATFEVISDHHGDLGLTKAEWGKRNKRAALDLHKAGKSPEACVAALRVAFTDSEAKKFYGGITTLAKLQEHWPKLAFSQPRVVSKSAGLDLSKVVD